MAKKVPPTYRQQVFNQAATPPPPPVSVEPPPKRVNGPIPMPRVPGTGGVQLPTGPNKNLGGTGRVRINDPVTTPRKAIAVNTPDTRTRSEKAADMLLRKNSARPRPKPQM